MEKLITFIVPTRNLTHLRTQLDNFERTTFDYSKIEFLIKVDSDHEGASAFIEEQISIRPFKIRYISTPRIDGTFSLWIAVDQLFGMVDKSCYFVQVLSDEPYFMTPDWDSVLERYVGLFPDHVFRLRLSDVKFNNYASSYECAFRCDSFPLYTRRWLELTEGTGDCWGSDAYQQLVAFHMSLGTGGYTNYYRHDSICRDIPVLDLKMGGLDFGVGVSSEMQKERHLRNLVEWNRLSTYKMQLHFSYLARRVFCYISATQLNIDSFQLVRDINEKKVKVVSADGSVILERSYKIQKGIIYFQNITRNIRTLYWIQLSPNALMAYHVIKSKLNRLSAIRSRLINKIKIMSFMIIYHLISLMKFFAKETAHMMRLFLHNTILFKSIKQPLITSTLIKRLPNTIRQQVESIVRFFNIFNRNIGDPSKSKVRRNEFLELNSPGINVLYKNKFRLSPGVKPPTAEERAVALSIIEGLQNNRDKYRNMEFISGDVQ